MAKNLLELIIEIIFWVFLIILAYQLSLKIIGRSPTDFTILYTGFGVIIAYLLNFTYKTANFIGRVEEFMGNTKESFKRIKEDINQIIKKI